jgi:hypothetical protein
VHIVGKSQCPRPEGETPRRDQQRYPCHADCDRDISETTPRLRALKGNWASSISLSSPEIPYFRLSVRACQRAADRKIVDALAGRIAGTYLIKSDYLSG